MESTAKPMFRKPMSQRRHFSAPLTCRCLCLLVVIWLGTATGFGALTVTAFYPANNATNVCPDTPLRITFDAPPTVTNAGQIHIIDAVTGVAVDRIDMGAHSNRLVQARSIGGQTLNTFSIYVSSNTAWILPHAGKLGYNQTYYVTVSPGTFADRSGASFSQTNAAAWRFTTKAAAPSSAASAYTIAADGAGDFCTLQGLVDFLPAGNTNHRTLHIRNGEYFGIVIINGKHNLNFIGQSRAGTLVKAYNNETFNSGSPNRMAFKVNADDITLQNLTLQNLTGNQGGGHQAEAITLFKNAKRFILHRANLISYQDTWMASAGSQSYLKDCRIEGGTDFMWGAGTAFFADCELLMLGNGHAYTQTRTPAGVNGFAYYNCRLTRLKPAINKSMLGQTLGHDNGNTSFIKCQMDAHITGWRNLSTRCWESQNTDLTGTSAVTYNGTQLAAADPLALSASSPAAWLGWVPVIPGGD